MSIDKRPRVKICGITNQEDALDAIHAGADALGFNLWPGSKRHMDLDSNADWLKLLPPFVTKVAVLVNAPVEEVMRVIEHPAIDLVQLHGDEDAVFTAEIARSGRQFIKALRIGSMEDLEAIPAYSTRHILADANVAGAFGGTGQMINLELAAALVNRYPEFNIILAGGLTPENVADAVRSVRPFGVDVASGVERVPGKKDQHKLRAFIEAATHA